MKVSKYNRNWLRITLEQGGEMIEVHTMGLAMLLISEGARFVAMSGGRLRVAI